MVIGPIPPYSNPPITPQFFQPSRFVIIAITLGQTTTITTSVNHNYVLGQEVRIIIPPTFGSRGLNGQTGFVISIPAGNQVVLDTFSIGIDPFKASVATTQPQIVAIGDNNSGIISSTGRNIPTTNIPGAFINISPL
jgi:hypothetical protein